MTPESVQNGAQAGAKITVTIGSDGATRIQVEGVAGSSCQSLTRDLERALGLVTRDQKTPEYYQSQTQGARHAQ